MAEVKNFEIARLFYEIAALLEARQESRFRIRAYQRAAQTLETLSEDVAAVAARTRQPLHVARAIAGQVIDVLRAHGGIDRIEIAGSLRRGRENVKDIDILVTSREPARVMRTFTTLPATAEVLGHGPTRATILHQEGLHVDLRVVEPEAFGAALQYFTGSKEHNVRVREIAVRKGLRLSEYGVFDEGGTRIAGATEADVYAAVGLPWIAPELRENTGEI